MRKLIIFNIILIILSSCEDKIDVDLDTAQPRLVVEASINWYKNIDDGSYQTIKLSKTTSYFNNVIPPVSGAQVSISDEDGNEFIFTESALQGIYETENFVPQTDKEYYLSIIFEGETYSASEILKSVADIEFVEQNTVSGFTEKETEIKAYFTDPPNVENFYMFTFSNPLFDTDVYKDEFFDGNRIFSVYRNDNINPGDEIVIQNFGISKQYYNYMFTLLSQTSDESGGPFETQPATVKGNIINETNPSNFAFGYFRLSEVDEFIYLVE